MSRSIFHHWPRRAAVSVAIVIVATLFAALTPVGRRLKAQGSGLQGPVGPTGPTGPAGPPGAPGAAGVPGVSAAQGYEVVAWDEEVAGNGTGSYLVQCPAGKKAIGGGLRQYGADPGSFNSRYPESIPGFLSSWRLDYSAKNKTGRIITIYAICISIS